MIEKHAGYFNSRDFPTSRVPMVTIVKCGSANEYRSAQTTANNTGKDISSLKPGNRGKRDSQMLLMNFLSFVIDKEHQLMDELHYELYYRIKAITGRDASDYSIVLMVDADTTVESDALRYMVNAMNNDELIMGLCGETRIANKRTSWVTMIQVFEYYISHHLGKSFESMFGGVTCLPGCFCMYRIYAHKGDGVHTVPLLTAPEIVNEYAEPQVDTLHKKNLLLLGEDRFLSTLMLRTFPKRKMVFVPQAICRTIVPDQFKVLLSQRRRWINSTIHNLMQLVQIRELCGTFCLSMRFVVALELLGTVVMPAALLFTFYLLLSAIFTGKVEVLPLTMLILMLGLPGVLILITTWKWIYVSWMFIYILAMPIWNFVLPLYAFWNFDDFSWGQTRVADGGNGAHGEGDENRRDETVEIVPRLRFEDWERERIEGRYNTVGSVPSRPADSVKVVSNGPSNARNLPFFGINLSRDNSVVSDSNSVQIVELPFTESINSYSNDQSLTSELNQNGNPNRRKNTNQTKQNSGFESTGSSSIGQSSSTASTVSLKNMRDHILDMFIQNSPVIERTTKSNDQATSYSAGSQAEAKNVDARAELSKASNNNLSRREMAKSTKNLPKINSMRDVSSETPKSSQTRQDSTISPICVTNIKNSHQHNYQPDPLSPTFSILANKVKEFENRSKNKWEKTGGGTESSSSVVEKIDGSSFDSVPVPPHKRAGKTSIEEETKLSEAKSRLFKDERDTSTDGASFLPKKTGRKLPTPPTANGTTDSDEDSNLESVKGKENAASSSSTRIRPSGPRIDTNRVGKSRSINSGSSRSSQPSPYFPVYDGGIPIPGTSYHSQYSAGSAEYASVPYYHHPVYYPHHEATFGQPYSYGQTPPEFFNYMRSSGYLSNPGSIQNNPSRTSIETGSSSYINPYQSGVPHHGFVPTRASIESMRSHHSYHSTGYVPMQFPQTQYSGYGSMISPAVPGHITYNYGSDDENASQ
ncbi:Chitin synthase, class 3 [Nowakowskiella sp. JEL0407]|nr:Chitin synthase, class 3 [Nowakowskiella sp. JEL0407]